MRKRSIPYYSIIIPLTLSITMSGCGGNEQEPIESSPDRPAEVSGTESPEPDSAQAEEPDLDIDDSGSENADTYTEDSGDIKEGPSDSDDGGIISCMREYLYPGNEIARFYVEEGNYYDRMSMIDYRIFDVESIIPRLYGDVQSEEQRDRDNDGRYETIFYTYEHNNAFMISDNNGDGYADWWSVGEYNDGVHNDFQVVWTDADYNGTVDQVDTIVAFPDDVENSRFSVKYTYGDFTVTNWDTGECDYSNAGRIQIAIMDSVPIYSDLKISQFFRDLDADGYVDQIVRWTWYDTNYDGVDDSMKVENDRDMDGVFEDSYAFDGKILENSLLY